MLMKSFLIGGILASLPLALVAASEPTPAPMAPAFLTAQASHPTPQPSPTAAPAAPVAASPSAQTASPVPSPVAAPSPSAPAALSPSAAAGLSVTVDAEGDGVEAEEVGEDGKVAASTLSPDLGKLDSETLALIAGGVDNSDTQEIFFDPKAKQILSEGMPGAWRVSVEPLYNELARRTLADNKDKAARQSFALALFKDGERAKYAKDLAFDDHSADVVIAQLEGGRASARMDLQKLAEKGNRKARLYLGMDQPVARAEAGSSAGLTAGSPTTPSAAVAPMAATPNAATIAPQPVSAPAQPSASPASVSPPAAPSPKK